MVYVWFLLGFLCLIGSWLLARSDVLWPAGVSSSNPSVADGLMSFALFLAACLFVGVGGNWRND